MNSRIRVLPPSVAERIAAGEVIERPGSVVKELVENSLDACATEITVILEDGGKALIEIIDNGSGMDAEELGLAIQRHATSKLHSLDDLERISTLGFRGEALPSVAAVSELSLLSRRKGVETAYELVVGDVGSSSRGAPQAVTFGSFLGSEHGTRLQARGLFSQIPARLKFLKSKSAEVSHVREWIERLALSRPEIGFRLISDDRTILNLKADTEAGRVKAILSDGEDYPVVTASETGGPMKVKVHWLQGLSLPHTRKLIQVVNGRAVRDRLLQQAILSGFKQALLPGQFPALLLSVEVDPSQLDVNVHPTKTEIRFLETRRIFPTIGTLLEEMIRANGAPAYAPPPVFFTPSGSSPEFRSEAPPVHQPSWNFNPQQPSTSPSFMAASEPQSSEDFSESLVAPSNSANPFRFARLLGTIFNTYLLYDLGDELGLVDQHAADERVRYERLRARVLKTAETGLSPQSLLLPEAIRFPAEARLEMESRLSWLEQLGFETEVFGEDTLLFRAVPAEWGSSDLKTRLKSLVERVLAAPSGAGLLLDETLFEKLASEACHSSVRAGDRLEHAEAHALVNSLFQCEHPWNCPHGRPTVVRVSRGKFEEWFLRRV